MLGKFPALIPLLLILLLFSVFVFLELVLSFNVDCWIGFRLFALISQDFRSRIFGAPPT